MCAGAPKAPKVEKIPQRQPFLLPDGGDPTVRAALKGQRRLTSSAMIFATRQGTLGAPSVSGDNLGGATPAAPGVTGRGLIATTAPPPPAVTAPITGRQNNKNALAKLAIGAVLKKVFG